MRTLTVRFEDATYNRMRVSAARTGLSMNAWVERLCDLASKLADSETVASGMRARGMVAESLTHEADKHEMRLCEFARATEKLPADDGGRR